MIKNILSLVLTGVLALFSGQQTAISPFKLEDYKKFQEKYIAYVNENPQKAIKIQDDYYSPKKLDSLLLIKDKLKKAKLSLIYSDPKKIEEYYKQEPDDVILPFAYFRLKESDFYMRANRRSVFMLGKDKQISVAYIDKLGKDFSRDAIFERITDLKNETETTNRYQSAGILISSSNANSTYGFPVGINKDYDKTGNLISSKDWDKNIEFGLKDLLKTYKEKINDYLQKNKDSLGYSYQQMIKALPKINPGSKSKILIQDEFSGIEKIEINGVFFWKVYVGSLNYFLFDTKTGKIFTYEKINFIG